MAWTKPPVDLFVDGKIITASVWNTFVRDNWMSSPLGKATEKNAGSLLVSRSHQQVDYRRPLQASAMSTITVSSQWPSGPDEESTSQIAGPSLTFTHGGAFQAFWSAGMIDTNGNAICQMAPEISGVVPDQLPNTEDIALRTNNIEWRRGMSGWLFDGMEPGETTVTMKYGVLGSSSGSGSSQWRHRVLMIVPM